MRLALVHDWLDRRLGGAERVLLEMAALWPEAPIHTLLFDASIYAGRIDPARVRTSFLQRLPAALRRRPRYLLPLVASATEGFDLGGYDVVVSSSSAFAKNVVTGPRTLHVCYCHTPMRFLWDYWPRYLDEMGVGPLRSLAIRSMTSRLRVWDVAGSGRVDLWLANSATTARRIRKFYGAEARVLHPGADLGSLEPGAVDARDDHYLTLGTLTEYKRIDLAIAACNRSGRRLVVVGDGPMRSRLEAMAGPTVSFRGHLDDAGRRLELQRARALLFPSEEDFGIAPVEAMACGTPVVGLGRGGLTETVVDGSTGVLYEEETTDSLLAALDRFEASSLRVEDCTERARRFDVVDFRRRLAAIVEEAHAAHAAAASVPAG